MCACILNDRPFAAGVWKKGREVGFEEFGMIGMVREREESSMRGLEYCSNDCNVVIGDVV